MVKPPPELVPPKDDRSASEIVEVVVVRSGAAGPETREVVREQPLRLLVNGESVATLMCLPGRETDLAFGFVLTEGIVRSARDVGTVSFCPEGSLGAAGEARVQLAAGAPVPARKRYREVFSSCGLCGDELIEEVARDLPRFEKPPGRLCAEDVFRLRDAMEAAQVVFRRTGGTHAAALGEVPIEAEAPRVVACEDIGRHNALDKAVGAAARSRVPFERALLFLSGRLSLEMVVKAARAGISDVAGVSAPSAAGVALARKLGMFLAGFVRADAMTIYSGAEALAAPGGG
jgi:FdhD protein